MKNTRRRPLNNFWALFAALLVAACALLAGSPVQAQPTLSKIYPNGTNLFQPSTTLSFTANATAGVTNVTIALTVSSPYTGQSFLKNLSFGNGLTTNGPATALNVSAVLNSNTLYSALIQVQDANGATANQTVTFDTITPTYVWEAEDWDYTDTNTSVANLYIDNPQTNAYKGLATTVEGSNNNGPGAYRPSVPGPSTETTGDTPRLPYINTGFTDYDVGWTDGGEFANFTRHYPAGTYNVFARAAGGNGPRTEAADVSILSGTATISSPASGPYKFGIVGRGWQNYDFMPVTDSAGNLVQITFDGTPSTIQVTQNQANDNMNFFMLMPVNTNIQSSTVTISNVFPDGTYQFQWTNTFSFTAHSSAGSLDTNGISVQLAITNLFGVGRVTNLSLADGLTITGDGTDITVSTALSSNMIYSAFIQVNDGNGTPAAVTESFDTVLPVFTFEAEEYNFGDGQFIDNPSVDGYVGVFGDPGVDYFVDDPFSGSHAYRDNNPAVGGPATEGSGDVPRLQYSTNNFPDYDVGFNDPANWENYTRTFPAGVYNIFLRGANGGGGVGSASLGLVTSSATTSNQTVSTLGSFKIPSTGNWQKYIFAPLKDASGNIVKVTFNGTNAVTLRVFGPNSANTQFYLLEPADTSTITVASLYPDGTSLFQQTNTFSFSASSISGIATSNIVVTLNGVVLSNLTFTGSSTSWVVTYPNLQPNQTYTASISIKSQAGGIYNNSITFDTYSANYYEWEASDFDYASNGVSGLYFDNPQTNAYNQLGAAVGIDELETTTGAPIGEDLYRTNSDGSLLVTTQPGGDLPRAKFATQPSWRINWFGAGDFCNYTRHYPAGTYKIVGRFTEGGSASSARLLKVTAGLGTSNQTTVTLGSFTIPANGWNGWEFATLVDGGGNPVPVTLDGSQTTFQLAGPAVDDSQTINAGFFMLVPYSVSTGIVITPSLSAGQIKLSFPTTTGSNYQLLYKTNLTDATWLPLGSPVPGNNSVQSVQDTMAGGHRFYRVQVQ